MPPTDQGEIDASQTSYGNRDSEDVSKNCANVVRCAKSIAYSPTSVSSAWLAPTLSASVNSLMSLIAQQIASTVRRQTVSVNRHDADQQTNGKIQHFWLSYGFKALTATAPDKPIRSGPRSAYQKLRCANLQKVDRLSQIP
ncbi:unnamed protein product [Heligmosomoides polygyrus]|uniref:Acetyltransferase n=1 Tax=Heligmosomoides polygyrus TaxID=6339 RepID=A0A183FKC1_HELPZ|nr:unnamed protein product [Heligmosomoides polygyrus]